MKTKNAISAAQNTLREVDDFNITIDDPKQGKMTLHITLGEWEPVACVLCAESDDLQKLKEWMEAIARDERRASVALGSGGVIACELTDIPESSVEKTYRYLDEQFPSPIGIFTITTENGEAYSAVLKVKHFINLLYVSLLTGGYDYPRVLRKHWYPYTKKYQQSANFPKWMRKQSCWHQSMLASPLLEWYLQSSESYTDAKPQFKGEFDCAYMLSMWADFGSCIFWRHKDGASVEAYFDINDHSLKTDIYINGHVFSFSDIKGLNEWYAEFHSLSYEYDEIGNDFPEDIIEEEITNESKLATLQKTREWHIRGFKLAQEARKRLPINVMMIYEQSWDVANGLHYFGRDKGRIIFDPRKLKAKQD